MNPLASVALLLAGLAIGALAASAVARRLRDAMIGQALAEATTRAAAREAELSSRLEASETRRQDFAAQLEAQLDQTAARDAELRTARTELTRLATEEATFKVRLEELARSETQLKDAFTALCGDALKSNNEQFLQLARTELERIRVSAKVELDEKESAITGLLTPIREGLEKYDSKLQQIELARAESFASLTERIQNVAVASEVLRGETANLAKAMRSSNVRGAWGELQLKRTVELAGMVEHCDFQTQHTVNGEDSAQRPDLIVRLPGNKTIVVDAKTPATAVLEAVNCQDDARRRQLCAEHVVSVRKHIDTLSKRAYWDQFEHAPEFIVLFLPSEAFFSVALEFDPTLFEHAFEQKVIVATPTTLIAVLKAVAYGWRQDMIGQNAQEVAALGRELYDRIRVLGDHFADVGNNLRKSVEAYNRAVGSMERRVLPAARKFQALGASDSREIAQLDEVVMTPALLTAPEMSLGMAPGGEA